MVACAHASGICVVMGVDNRRRRSAAGLKSTRCRHVCRASQKRLRSIRSRGYNRAQAGRGGLRESEALFRAFFEQAAVGIAGISVEGRYVFANQRFCDLLRRPLDEVLQMTTAQPLIRISKPWTQRICANAGWPCLQCTTEKLYVRATAPMYGRQLQSFRCTTRTEPSRLLPRSSKILQFARMWSRSLARERCALESRVEERTRQLNKTIKFLNIQAAQRERAEVSIRTLSARLLQLQDEERRRIARELHDSAGQILAALDMQLSIVQTKTQYLESDLTSVVSDSVSLVQRSIPQHPHHVLPPASAASR